MTPDTVKYFEYMPDGPPALLCGIKSSIVPPSGSVVNIQTYDNPPKPYIVVNAEYVIDSFRDGMVVKVYVRERHHNYDEFLQSRAGPPAANDVSTVQRTVQRIQHG